MKRPERVALTTVRGRANGWQGVLLLHDGDEPTYEACRHRHRTKGGAMRCADGRARDLGLTPDDET